MLGELDTLQVNNVLMSQVMGRLACTDGTTPYIVPVTYAYDGTYIYGQTNAGKKLDILRQNPNVCFEVAIIMDMANWRSVLVYGKFEELKKEEAAKARDILFGRVFSLMTSCTIHSTGHEIESDVDDANRVKKYMYRIVPEKITARFESQSY